jgi:hypothetical protein
MSWASTVGAFLQLLLLIVSKWMEVNNEDKKKKQAIVKELSDAIKAGDTSSITLALSKLR